MRNVGSIPTASTPTRTDRPLARNSPVVRAIKHSPRCFLWLAIHIEEIGRTPMSENDEFDIDNLDDDLGTDVVRQLRKAYKAKQKEVDQLRKQVEEFSSASRKSVVEGVLTEKGVDVRISKFIPESVTTVDEVEAWISENADLFGLEAQPQEESEEVQAAARIASVGSAATAVDAGDLKTRIANAQSQEELNEILFGNPYGPVK